MATAVTYRYCKLRIRYLNVEVPAVMVGRIIYFPLRALCKIIGITPQTQIEKIQSDPRFVSAWQDLPVPTIKGLRRSTCLRKLKWASGSLRSMRNAVPSLLKGHWNASSKSYLMQQIGGCSVT